MTNDLTKRLRERSGQYDEYDWHSAIELEAANEIERLQAEVETLRKQVAKWEPIRLHLAKYGRVSIVGGRTVAEAPDFQSIEFSLDDPKDA